MLDFYLLLSLPVVFAGFFSIRKKAEFCVPGKMNLLPVGKIFFVVLFLSCVFFQATRTKYNDTIAYIQLFKIARAEDSVFECFSEPYAGFFVLQILVKRITTNFNVYLLFYAIPINFVFLRFIFKYSKSISQSLLIYITGTFLFSMGGMKQALAMACALIAFELYFSEKKWLALILLAIGYLFHPYILIFLIAPFLKDKVLSVKLIAVSIIFLFAFFNLDTVFSLVSNIGRDFSEMDLSDYTVNPLRVIVEFIPIAIMIYGRKKIVNCNNPMLNMGVNMCAISWFFIFISLFINPIYPGRIATYFNLLYMVTMPTVLKVVFNEQKNKTALIVLFYLIMFVYFMLDFTKIGTISITNDRFGHNSIVNLFYW